MSKRAFIFLSFIFLVFSSLWAGGWNNTLMGCRAIALGGAFVGVADDPSAIFYNPAGLVFQRNRIKIYRKAKTQRLLRIVKDTE